MLSFLCQFAVASRSGSAVAPVLAPGRACQKDGGAKRGLSAVPAPMWRAFSSSPMVAGAAASSAAQSTIHDEVASGLIARAAAQGFATSGITQCLRQQILGLEEEQEHETWHQCPNTSAEVLLTIMDYFCLTLDCTRQPHKELTTASNHSQQHIAALRRGIMYA